MRNGTTISNYEPKFEGFGRIFGLGHCQTRFLFLFPFSFLKKKSFNFRHMLELRRRRQSKENLTLNN